MPRVRRWFRDLLELRGVGVVEHSAVDEVDEASVLCSNGDRIGFDELIWVTQAGAASWLADTGLELDEGGFIKIDATLAVAQRSPMSSPSATWPPTSSIRGPRPACSPSGKGRRWRTICAARWLASRSCRSCRSASSCR